MMWTLLDIQELLTEVAHAHAYRMSVSLSKQQLVDFASGQNIYLGRGIRFIRSDSWGVEDESKHAVRVVRLVKGLLSDLHQMIIDAGAYPSAIGYGGFSKSVCTSVNECLAKCRC
nr:methionine aminopeptidase 1D, chloroplastic/mitochondrial [Tanacetum cinerariifolium]